MLVFTGILLGLVLFVMVGEEVQEMQVAQWLPENAERLRVTWFQSPRQRPQEQARKLPARRTAANEQSEKLKEQKHEIAYDFTHRNHHDSRLGVCSHSPAVEHEQSAGEPRYAGDARHARATRNMHKMMQNCRKNMQATCTRLFV